MPQITLPSAHSADEARPSTQAQLVVSRMPHDPRAFTQGLVFSEGVFFESTGEYGESTLRRVDPESGRVLRSVPLAPQFFGEGLALLHGELFQLTWREHRCFVYDAATFDKKRELAYDGEGWGLATDPDGGLLVMSDGSAVLRFVDPQTFRVVRTVNVVADGQPVTELNELEWVRGEVYANVWGTNVIVRIDPATGNVRGHLELSALPEPHHDDADDVLNGIAYDTQHDRLFVTGKRWTAIYEIRRPGQ